MEDVPKSLNRASEIDPQHQEQPAVPHPGSFVARLRGRPLVPIIALLTIFFFVLTFLVLESDLGPTPVDVDTTLTIQRLPYVPIGAVLIAVSWPGFFPWNYAMVGMVLGFMLWRRWYPEAVFTGIAAAGGLLAELVKLLVDRPRPSPDLVNVVRELYSYSFPSGHVTSYTMLFGFLFYLAYTLLPRAAWFRVPLLVFFGAFVVLVGPSRVYMGQHWASDALGGYTLGFAYLLVVTEIYRAWQDRHPKAPQPKEDTGTTNSR